MALRLNQCSHCVFVVFLPDLRRVGRTYPIKFTNLTKLLVLTGTAVCRFSFADLEGDG